LGDSSPASIVVTAERSLLKAVEGALTSHPEFFHVVASTTKGDQAVGLVTASEPDVAVLDLEMAGLCGVQAVRDLRGRVPRTAVVVIAGQRGDLTAAEAMRAGAAVHLTKRDTRQPARVRAAVYVAGDGGRMVAPDGVPSLISAIGSSGVQAKAPSGRRALTPREREVLALMANGGTNRQIATSLEISEQSVKNHISNLLRKLGARNRTEAAAVARRDGLVG
jgi:DNA-binding NarL/FixJ family response regulator